MKKFLAILLAVFACTALFSACKEESKPQSGNGGDDKEWTGFY